MRRDKSMKYFVYKHIILYIKYIINKYFIVYINYLEYY